jgi:hypothetical protein
MPAYSLYIDDSGTKEYATAGQAYGRDGGKSRYFVFGGMLIRTDLAGPFFRQIADLKQRVFGTSNVEIKSNWLRIPHERERRYKTPYGVTDGVLTGFVSEYYALIGAADLQLLAAVVDKQHMQDTYANPWYAPAAAYEALMQRVVQEVRHPDTVSVYVDDMMGATPLGSQYKDNLKRHHQSLRTRGSTLLRQLDFRPLGDLAFVNSANSHPVQVADIVAYNVYRQFLEHGEAWEEDSEQLPTYEWFLRLGGKFRQGPDNRIQGFGVVKFPLKVRVPWSIRDQ